MKSPRRRAVAKPDWRDQVALQVMVACMPDLSRQLANGHMPLQDADKAVSFIAGLSYGMADAMLIARNAK